MQNITDACAKILRTITSQEYGVPYFLEMEYAPHFLCVNIKYDERFILVFAQKIFSAPAQLTWEDLEPLLIYDLKKKDVVDTANYKMDVLFEDVPDKGYHIQHLSAEVRSRVNARIQSKADLSVKELPADSTIRRDTEYLLSIANRTAMQLVREGKEPELDVCPPIKNSLEPLGDYLKYLKDPDSYINAEVDKIIQAEQLQMLSNFMVYDSVKQEFDKIMSSVGLPVLYQRAIVLAIDALPDDAKMVQMKVELPDGREVTGAYEAVELKQEDYSIYGFAAPVRKELLPIRDCACIDPKSIARITYRGKTLYERNNAL